jgi:hypothetical protein
MAGIALGAALLSGGCTTKFKPPPSAPGLTGPLVTPDSVQLIFDNHCVTCHGGSSPQAGQNLTADSSYSMIVNHVSIKCAPLMRVLPFDPDNSCLMLRITGRVLPRMPFMQPALSPADTTTIYNWIKQGAPGEVKATVL